MAVVSDDIQPLKIYGLLSDISFHKSKGIAEALVARADDFDGYEAVGMMEFEWCSFLDNTKKVEGGETWGFSGPCIVYHGKLLIGSATDLETLARDKYDFEDFRPLPLLYAMGKEEYKQHLERDQHDFVYLDISIGNTQKGRLVIELFNSKCPKTCENFKHLCVGDKEESARHTPPLALKYKGSCIHRIVEKGWIQGGDFERGSGDGGESIYGPTFEDENFSVKHNKRGIVGMANSGRHSNGSQFYITLAPTPWMDKCYVAFGHVVEGSDTLAKLEQLETFNQRPVKECVIADCGMMDIVAMAKIT